MKKSVFLKVACIALVTVGIITLNSCTKENIENGNNLVTTKVKEFDSFDEIMDGIKYSEFQIEVENHNHYLNSIFEIFDFDADNYQEELIRCILELELDTNELDIDAPLMTFNDMIYEIYTTAEIDDANRVVELVSLLDADIFEHESFEYISHIVDSVQSVAFKELKGVDLMVVFGYSELLYNSSYYWMPNDWGGCGTGFEILNNRVYIKSKETDKPSEDKTTAEIIGEVALTDAAYMAGGCIVTAIGGAINPALALPLLKAAVKRAAKKSAKAAINNIKN